ncbi:MAG: hypothetical protein AAB209_02010, partial [Bacteroidota bacterium]
TGSNKVIITNNAPGAVVVTSGSVSGEVERAIAAGSTLTPLSGTPTITIQNITLNTSAVSIGGDFQVFGTLTLTDGVLTTGSNKVHITNYAPGAVVVTSGSVNGEVERAILAGSTGTYVFTDLNTR